MSGDPHATAEVRLVALLIATLALSGLLTWLAIRYALHRRLLDLPGQRRSHDVPTPRGGGIAIVAAMLAGGLVLALQSTREYLPLLWPPIVGIALVGWLDDHGGLSAAKRFAMHTIAAAWVFAGPLLLTVFPVAGQSSGLGLAAIAAVVVTIAIVWSINLHNFMDGINGLLTLQAIFVLCSLAGLLAWRDADGAALLLGLCVCLRRVPALQFPARAHFHGRCRQRRARLRDRSGCVVADRDAEDRRGQRAGLVFRLCHRRELHLAFAHAARSSLV